MCVGGGSGWFLVVSFEIELGGVRFVGSLTRGE